MSSSATAVSSARAASAPSMCSTIAVSPPSCGTIVATFRPSRRIVARSQVATTSASRCVMNRTERPRSRHARITVNTRSARSDGSAAVISSSTSSCGSCAIARARSIIRCIGSGTSPARSEKSTSRFNSRRCPRTDEMLDRVRRRFCATVRSGTSAGSWKTGARPIRAACAGEDTRTVRPATTISPASALITPVRTLTSVLLPAPFAPSSAWISPGATSSSADVSATTGPYVFRMPRASRSVVADSIAAED